ncbi:FecR family protein [Cupriavidus necator]
MTKTDDTLHGITARYLSDSESWTTLARMNHVHTPRRLQAGIELHLPVALLRQEYLTARVMAMSGLAEYAFGNAPFRPLSVGMRLAEGDRVRTAHNGFATLELIDGSHVCVMQDSMIEIGTLRRTTLMGANSFAINLRQGQVDSRVTHARRKSDRFQIASPLAVAGVRGTRFRMNYLHDRQSSALEVLDGTVGLATATPPGSVPQMRLPAATQIVPAGFGSVTQATGMVGELIELLPAPALLSPGKVQDAKDVVFDIVARSDASAYRVQIARDAEMLDLIRDDQVPIPHALFGDLPDGTYFVRLAAIDHNGLAGLSQIYAFERRQLELAVSAVPLVGTRHFEFRWSVSRQVIDTRFRFVLAAASDLSHPIVDLVDLSESQVVVTNLPSGVYFWTVLVEQFENGRFYEKGSATRSFTLAY